ncbi:hypothetical protein SAPIO_CDS2562 [Scedosporium apiospermum]|uniref:Rhodopsin domain-containing protein n=1 Tax=Pseudallescheria apiosperma TaxID=563466 RepID=A0A084GCR3_PSEDA|nr:uncharacterized protein SAPIO_CDS2562 [Scedosporium apiospermum]KEZ45125.1 hypothetical protein SAPIO_CDS2562 [Scedosporium apiospermum]
MSSTTDTDLPPSENVGPLLIALSGVLIFFVIVTTILRMWIRTALHTLGWDDATMCVVTVIAIIRYGLQIVQVVSYGNGKHRPYVDEQDYVMNNQLGWWAQICLFSGICVLKLSIMLLILRLKDSKNLKIILYCAMAGLIITNFGVIVILLAECRPVGYWRGNGECWEPKVRIYSIYFTIAYSIVTDFLCSLLPLVVIWKVRIPFKTKFMAWSLMSLGLIATGFGIARAASLGIITNDLTWTYAIAAIWSNLEFYLGIIAANLALSRQIYLYFFRGETTPHDTNYGNRNQYLRSSFSNGPRSAHRTDNLRGDKVMDRAATLIEGRRRPSVSRSDGSEVELEAGIRKKTEFWISEEENESHGSYSGGVAR